MSSTITQQRYTDGKPLLRRFHQARWDEALIYELSRPGQRGLLVPAVEEGVQAAVGDVLDSLPPTMRRQKPPALPEIVPAAGRAPLFPPLAGKSGRRPEYRCRAGYLHHETQPQDQ